MTSRVRALCLGLLLPCVVSTLTVSPALYAQDDPQVTAEARKRFQEGVKLFDEKKFELARAAFLQAYALKKHPDVLLNLAQAELLSGKAFDAANHFKEFLKDPATKDHPKRGDAERGLSDARQRIGRIQVAVDVAGAEVFLDGKKVGDSPLAEVIDVPPGPHVVEAKKGGKAQSSGVMAPEGKITVASISLEGGAVAPPPPPKDDKPNDKPKDDKPKDDKPKDDKPKDDKPKDDGFSVSTAGKREPFITWAKRSPVAWGGAGLFGVGLIGGLVFKAGASADQSSADKASDQIKQAFAQDAGKISGNPNGVAELCKAPATYTVNTGRSDQYVKACGTYNDSRDAKDGKNTMATVSFIAAGVGAAVVIGGYFVTAKKESTDGRAPAKPLFMAAPQLGSGYAGLSALGTF